MSTAHRVALFVLFASILGCSASTKPEAVTPESSAKNDNPSTPRFHHQFPPAMKMVLDEASVLELSSLEPDINTEKWTVLGKTQVTDGATRKRIMATLERGMENARGGAKCFYPRHAVSASYGGEHVEVVICFQCGQLSINGAVVEFTSDEQPLLDAILTAAGVPLAKKWE